ncbi:STAS domain-containing protein [Streptomyces sp. NBC_00859]|uniref:STAS domain-containing protein n=1 Tax=Streptomyces sp. NBC_00859 TaxID=2903682 RepID=UPI00386B3657|nr:STAS domain-containing protein [Streptomyces sp. NBC_00859]
MTLPRPSFALTVEPGPDTAHLRLTGELDYDTCAELTRRAGTCLAENPRLRELHLDCAHLTLCDSMGLSTLIQIHRNATAHQVRLHLDNAPPFLERLLAITGTRRLFAQVQVQDQSHQAQARGGQTDEPHDERPPVRKQFSSTPPHTPCL